MDNQQNNQQNNRRQLPARANRGVRNEQNQQQIDQDNQFYQNLFGNVDDQDLQDESFSQQLGLRPLDTYAANFANYNYGRGYHYFFNLDTFPRVKQSPSYALDDRNRFKYTYKYDQVQINGTKIRKLLNRSYIGLPTIQTTIGNTKNLDKNVCHYHLFQTEDEKYYNHRLISKYQYILDHLDNLTEKNKLKQYTELKKDLLMQQVYDKQVSLERKRQILMNRIKVLRHRVQNMNKHWQWKDQMYFHFSQNQLFHNKALLKGKKLQQRHLKQRIFNRILSIKQQIQGTQQNSVTLGAEKPRKFIQNCLKLQEQRVKIISSQMQNLLCSSSKMIEMFKRRQQLIIFPSFMFRFGDSSRAVDSLMKAKLENDYESGFYIYKAFVKKLFKRDLNCQQERLQEPILSEDYQQVMKEKIIQIEDFYHNEQEGIRQKLKRKQLLIDNLIDLSAVQRTQLSQQVHLLPCESKTQITLKQLMLLYCYRNISVAMEAFLDYINRDPEILKFMADANYDNFHYGIARFIDSHEFCILINDIKRFTNLLMNTNLSNPNFNQILYFHFNSKLNLAYIWLEMESNDWETEKDQDQENQQSEDNHNFARNVFNDEFDPKPVKKVKKTQQDIE